MNKNCEIMCFQKIIKGYLGRENVLNYIIYDSFGVDFYFFNFVLEMPIRCCFSIEEIAILLIFLLKLFAVHPTGVL